MTLLERIGSFAGAIAGEAPPGIRREAEAHLLDSLVMMVAAREHPLTREAAQARLPFDADGESAFTAGVACDALGLDDFDEETRTHPGAVVVSALLGGVVASPQPVSGTAVLDGLITGYEVILRFGELAGASSLHDRGFHPSSVCGVIGAAAGLSLALGANPVAATGIAASLASGVFELDGRGAMKAMQTGWAASSALAACRLAEAGYVPAPTVLEGPRGLLRGFGRGRVEEEAIAEALGGPMRISRVSFKPYSHFTDLHPATAALLGLLRDGSLAVADLHEVEVRLKRGVGARLNAEFPPTATRLARRCPQFALAAAACRSDLEAMADPLLRAFDRAALEDPQILDLARRVRWIDDLPSDGVPAAVVTVRAADGRVVTASAQGYPGDGRSDEDRWSLPDVAQRSASLLPDHAGELITIVEAFETLPDARVPAKRLAAVLRRSRRLR